MIILRQTNYSGHSYQWQQEITTNTDDGISVSNGKRLDTKNNRSDEYISDSFLAKLNTAEKPKYKLRKEKKKSSKGGRGFNHVFRSKNGYLIYPETNYSGDHRDSAGRMVIRRSASDPKQSYRDSYRDFLRNERKISEISKFKDDPSKVRLATADLQPLTNEDIKNDIRKLARKEGIKRWAKDHKGAIIGGTVGTAALVGGSIALHKHKKKKEHKKQEE